MLPLVIPSYVGALTIISAFAQEGLIQQLVSIFWVFQMPDIYGFKGATLTLTLFTYPYMLLILKTALWRMDPELEEVSRSLGKNQWVTFWQVTLPQLRPAIGAGALLIALYTLSDFGGVSLLRFESLTQQIYVHYQGSFSRHSAAVFSLLLGLVSTSLLFIESKSQSRAQYFSADSKTKKPPYIIKLNKWKWPSIIFIGIVVGFGLLLPITVLTFWLLSGISAGEPLRLVWRAAINSGLVSALAAVTSIIVAIPIAILSVRYKSAVTTIIERSCYTGFALPGIVVALALVFFGANYGGFLYQSLPMLILAYIILFLPQAIGALRTSLIQVNPRLEEMGRNLGHTPLAVWLKITMPILRPGLIAAWALVFLTVMKELPATLLLSPIGFDTLATKIWSASSEAFYARAAAPSLLLVFLASASMLVLVRREGDTPR
ncbi:MAG: iron(III) transport system permease protein [Chloroflexi bacterium]|jgi:iron(III) transport system permease protein|nr:MAG: iron(III) transport system permease protein [Chloroflexota bacterium]